MIRLVPLAFLLVTACDDSGSSTTIDGGLPEFDAMSIPDAAAIADGPRPDAATENQCARHSLGLGRGDIAYADGYFAVARHGLGFEFKVTQFEENGTQAATISMPGQLFSSPPALAGRETFLIAYQGPPEDGLGLMPLTPGGGLGTTTFVPTTEVLGGQLSSLPLTFPRVAVSPSGTRAAAWVKDLQGDTDPELFFGLACNP